MNKGLLKKLQRKEAIQKDKRLSKIITLTYILSFVFIFYSVRQYNIIIIDFKIPISICLCSGLLFAILSKKNFQNTLKGFTLKQHYFLSIWVIGSFATSIFFFINNSFSNSNTYSAKVPIIETRDMRRGGYYVTVQTKDFNKDLVFSKEDKIEIDASRFVVLELNKGGFGFEIIQHKKLVK